MKFSIKKLPKSQIEITFEIPAEEFDKYYDKAVSDLTKGLKMAGFRPGKIPKEIAEKELDSAEILMTAANLVVKEKYVQAVLEKNLEVLGQPQLQILKLVKNNPFEFKAKTAVLPEAELPDYKSIASKTKKREVRVDEKEIESALAWLQRSRAKFSAKNGSCENGDFVEISYSSPQIENGREFKDGFILGKGYFVPGFEENIRGMSSNEKKEFSIKFPKKSAYPNLAEKEVNFKITVNSVQAVSLPEINDEWVKDLGRFENLTSLKQNIKEGLLREKEMAESQRIRQEMLEKIAESSKIEIPEILVESEKNKMLDSLKEGISQDLKISFQDYLARIKKTEKELADSFWQEAQNRIKNFLILREIAKRQNISVSEEEIKRETDKILGGYADIKKAEGDLDPEKLKLYTEGEIKNEKVFSFLESLSQ